MTSEGAMKFSRDLLKGEGQGDGLPDSRGEIAQRDAIVSAFDLSTLHALRQQRTHTQRLVRNIYCPFN